MTQIDREKRKEAARNLPGKITSSSDDSLEWELDSEGMEYPERMQVAITAWRSLTQLFPDREVGKVRDKENRVEISIR